MNDVVVVTGIDRLVNKESGKVGSIRINWELKAAGADAHHLDTYHVLRSCFKPKSHDASSCRNLYVKDTFSVRIPKIQYFVYCITVYLSRQVFRRDFPKKSLIRE